MKGRGALPWCHPSSARRVSRPSLAPLSKGPALSPRARNVWPRVGRTLSEATHRTDNGCGSGGAYSSVRGGLSGRDSRIHSAAPLGPAFTNSGSLSRARRVLVPFPVVGLCRGRLCVSFRLPVKTRYCPLERGEMKRRVERAVGLKDTLEQRDFSRRQRLACPGAAATERIPDSV